VSAHDEKIGPIELGYKPREEQGLAHRAKAPRAFSARLRWTGPSSSRVLVSIPVKRA
jgi:hypothetical protein